MERIASTAGGGGGPTGGGGDLDAPAVKLAWELAMLGSMENAMDSLSLNGSGAATLAQLEEMKNNNRKSANMTECVPVPTSEHVAEIVGRQGEYHHARVKRRDRWVDRLRERIDEIEG